MNEQFDLSWDTSSPVELTMRWIYLLKHEKTHTITAISNFAANLLTADLLLVSILLMAWNLLLASIILLAANLLLEANTVW